MPDEREIELLNRINSQMNTIEEQKEEIDDLRRQLANFRKVVYGQSSEKTEIILDESEQVIFNEAETSVDKNVSAEECDNISSYKRRKKRTHDELLKDLPVEEVVHTVENRTCDKCGTDEKRDANGNDIEKCSFRKAVVPKPLMPHSFCSAELLAHIIYEKYCKSVPLYRLEKDFEAMGFRLSRTTMANWIISASEKWFSPIYDNMKTELLKGDILHADETVVQVLKEPGKKAKTQSRMWVYCSPKASGKANVLFDYRPSRSGEHAKVFLGDYNGYLICDGYDGYNKLTEATQCGCWTHARR